jgi:hypothetical protein
MPSIRERDAKRKRRYPRRVIYDGRERLGAVEQLGDEFVAYDRRGQILGRYDGFVEAAEAIAKAAP